MEAFVKRFQDSGFDPGAFGRIMDLANDDLNAEFQGKRIPGLDARQSETTLEMIICAHSEWVEELVDMLVEAQYKFVDEKEKAEG